jgi:hypothetical protein
MNARVLLARKVDVILVVLAVVLVVAVVVDRGSVTTAEAHERRYQLFDAWRPHDINRVDIVIGDNSMRLDKLPDTTWALHEDGRDVVADEQAVGSLMVSLEFASFERPIEGLDAATTGLDTPRASYVLGMGPLSYALKIGNEAPSPKGSAYAEVSGGARTTKTYVIRAELIDELLIERGSLRTRRMAPYLSVELKRIELKGKFAIVRGAWGGRTAGGFSVESDALGRVRADRRSLDGWLAILARLDAEHLVAMPKDDPTNVTLVLTPIDDKLTPARIMMGGPCPGGGADETLVVRRQPDPIAGCVPSEVVKNLMFSAERLADNHVVGTAEGDLTEIKLSAVDVVVEMARKGTGWILRKPTEGPAEAEPTAALIKEMMRASGRRLSADAAADKEALGLATPRATVRLLGLPERGVDGAKERVETISIGTRQGDHVYVERLDDGAIIELGVEDARALLPRPSALRPLAIHNFSAQQVRELRLDCGHRQRMTRSVAGAWTQEEPDLELASDMGMASAFIEGFRVLRAVRWVSEKPDDAHALDRAWCKIEVDSIAHEGDEEITTTHGLRLGAEARGVFSAPRDGLPAVFVVPKVVGAMARAWMLDRNALLVGLVDVEQVRWRRGDKERTEQGGALSAVVDKALRGMVAEGVVYLGAPREGDFEEKSLELEVSLRGGDKMVLVAGKGDAWNNTSVYYVRREGIDVTFALAQSRLQPLIDAL